jgi:short-subunit dehydrogenase
MKSERGLAAVTGASSGIGEVYAQRLAARGYDLLLVARRQDRLEQLASRLSEQHGVRAEVLPADLSNPQGLKMVEERLAAASDLTLLVNNAGFGIRGLFQESDLEKQEEMHRLHIIATLRLTHAALRGMTARGRGAIVNVSSVAAFSQSPWNSTYSATKTWMNSFTEALAVELRTLGSPVKLQALCPGFTVTEFHDVMGVSRSIVPRGWWLTSEQVVDDSLRGLEQDKLIVIPGLRYKIYVFLLALIPNWLRRSLTVAFARRVRRRMAAAEGQPKPAAPVQN